MKVEFKIDDDQSDVGYTLIAETEEEEDALGRIRDLVWFSLLQGALLNNKDEMMRYAGRSHGHRHLEWKKEKCFGEA